MFSVMYWLIAIASSLYPHNRVKRLYPERVLTCSLYFTMRGECTLTVLPVIEDVFQSIAFFAQWDTDVVQLASVTPLTPSSHIWTWSTRLPLSLHEHIEWERCWAQQLASPLFFNVLLRSWVGGNVFGSLGDLEQSWAILLMWAGFDINWFSWDFELSLTFMACLN